MNVKDIKPIKSYRDVREGDIYCALNSSFNPCIGIVSGTSKNYFSYIYPFGCIGVSGDNIKKVLLLRPTGKGKLEILAGKDVIEELKRRG
jgi:hypothetical protein